MPAQSCSKFAHDEKRFIQKRCEEISNNVQALQDEHRVLEARLQALSTMEEIYVQTEDHLKSAHSIQKRINAALKEMGADENGVLAMQDRVSNSIR